MSSFFYQDIPGYRQLGTSSLPYPSPRRRLASAEAIEKTVKVNHMASIITSSPIDLGEKGSLKIESIRDWWK